jgi:GNAT superfamily N-acetyltransferase
VNLPAKRPLPRQRPSAPVTLELVRPGVTFDPAQVLTCQPERFADIARELPPLFQQHWQELGSNRDAIPLDPDWDRYFALEGAGSLRVMTARAGDMLAGYIFNIVGPHLHYRSTLHSEIEMFWLDPIYRGTWFSVRWARANEAMLDELGVKRRHVGIKKGYMDGRVAVIFKRLGYKIVEELYGLDS